MTARLTSNAALPRSDPQLTQTPDKLSNIVNICLSLDNKPFIELNIDFLFSFSFQKLSQAEKNQMRVDFMREFDENGDGKIELNEVRLSLLLHSSISKC